MSSAWALERGTQAWASRLKWLRTGASDGRQTAGRENGLPDPENWVPEIRLDRPSSSSQRNGAVVPVPHPGHSSDHPAEASGKPRERMEGGSWRLDRAGRSWAGAGPASIPGSSQVTDPPGPPPRPAAYSGGPARGGREQRSRRAESVSRLCARGARLGPPRARHPPWPPRPPPATSWFSCRCWGLPWRRS